MTRLLSKVWFASCSQLRYSEKLFQESAQLYDRIYGKVKNYTDEAEKVRSLISKHQPETKSILDVACGTGEHARLLSSTYEVDGLDLNSSFVEIARTKNPRGRFFVADMTDFDAGKSTTSSSVSSARLVMWRPLID